MQQENKTKILIFGIIVVIIGIMVGVIPIFLQNDKRITENKKVDDYIKETSIDNTQGESEYLLVLEIPKVNLKRGVYPIDSSENTIEKNVQIMREGTLPDEDNGNLVLAAHNGTAAISYFNQLHRLGVNDQAYIYYQGTKYTYIVDKIYDVSKDGDVEVYRDLDKNTLTLITCKKDTDDRQLVIILYLSEKENY